MPTAKTITYPDALFFPALMRAIESATSCIEVMTFIFKTSYVGETRAREVLQALKAAAARGVQVLVLLNYSRFESGVCSENFATAEELAAAGCKVKLGPRNQTVHTKMVIIDLRKVFTVSHNLTRGALSFNRENTVYSETLEMAERSIRHFNSVWRTENFLRRCRTPRRRLRAGGHSPHQRNDGGQRDRVGIHR